MNPKDISATVNFYFEMEDGMIDIRYNIPFHKESWKEVTDFVQKNFLQMHQNKFNSRTTIDPEHTPTDNRPATSSRSARERQTGRAAGEKPTEEKNTNKNPKERKKEIENKKESNAKKQMKKEPIGKNKKNKKNPIIEGVQEKEKDNVKPKRETNKAKKLAVNQGKRNASTHNSMGKVVSPKNTPISTNEIKIDPKVDYINTSISMNSTPSFRSSPSKNEKSPINNSLGKEAVIAKNNIMVRKGHACAKKSCEKEKDKKMPEKCESKAAISGMINKLKTLKSNVASGGTKSCEQTKTTKCAKSGSEKIATTESKKIGKFEQRLLEKQDRRAKRKLQSNEKKVERAMEKLNRCVTRMGKQVNYLSDDGSENDLDNDCCCNSSTESSYSDSCCSNSSCSCCTSCSSETSDYSECTSGSIK